MQMDSDADSQSQTATVVLALAVKDNESLQRISQRLRQINGVEQVQRV